MDASNGWAAVFATGYSYNVHFGDNGIDWNHLMI